MNIYVGNLSLQVMEKDLKAAFEAFGKVNSVVIIKDKNSGKSRGFGFIEMPNREQAEAAIKHLNGRDLLGRSMNVNEAHGRRTRVKGRNYYEKKRKAL